MKICATKEFFDTDMHTKKYYFCGIRYLKKIWSNTSRETYLFKSRIGKTKVITSMVTNNKTETIEKAPVVKNDKTESITLKTNGISIVERKDVSGEGKTGRAAIDSIINSDINFDSCFLDDMYRNYIPEHKKQLVFATDNFIKDSAYDIIPLLVWEFESGMPQVRPFAFQGISAIATFSTFCEKYFRKVAPKNLPIYVLPYPIDIDISKLYEVSGVREKYGIKPDDFVFFFNFSYHSSYFRKNPEGTLDAFNLAFPKHDKKIKLVIKSIGYDRSPDLVKRLQDKIHALGLQNNVILIDQNLTDYEVYSLINACDAYVSLHRGEGLGLGMMEAMYLGKPVIATNYGGNTDFTKPDTALLVDYKMVTPQEIDLDAYKYVEKWPEPNVETAAKHMRHLYKNKTASQELGKKAKCFIEENFNSDKFNKVIKEEIIYTKQEIDILIPVYNGYEYLENLFNSVIENTDLPYRLIVINDKSPDKRVANLLNKYKQLLGSKMILINNTKNLGFVKSVNKGLEKIKNHVCIVNSDVILPKNWASRLFHPIFNNPKVASVTPFSNAATIFSVPKIGTDNTLEVDLEDVNARMKNIETPYESIKFPTGVGFCMAMNKDAINKIGILDEIYEKGYAEENDWCQRAVQAGFFNTIAGNLFVWHKHGGSFLSEEKKRLCENHMKILLGRYPNYSNEVQRSIANPVFATLRFKAELNYYNLLAKRTILYVNKQHNERYNKQGVLYIDIQLNNANSYTIKARYNDYSNNRQTSMEDVFSIIKMLKF